MAKQRRRRASSGSDDSDASPNMSIDASSVSPSDSISMVTARRQQKELSATKKSRGFSSEAEEGNSTIGSEMSMRSPALSEKDSIFYFAYGRNMWHDEMLQIVSPQARCHGLAYMDGCRWIVAPSTRANLIMLTKAEQREKVDILNKRVYGVVWQLPKRHLDRLDQSEAWPGGDIEVSRSTGRVHYISDNPTDPTETQDVVFYVDEIHTEDSEDVDPEFEFVINMAIRSILKLGLRSPHTHYFNDYIRMYINVWSPDTMHRHKLNWEANKYRHRQRLDSRGDTALSEVPEEYSNRQVAKPAKRQYRTTLSRESGVEEVDVAQKRTSKRIVTTRYATLPDNKDAIAAFRNAPSKKKTAFALKEQTVVKPVVVKKKPKAATVMTASTESSSISDMSASTERSITIVDTIETEKPKADAVAIPRNYSIKKASSAKSKDHKRKAAESLEYLSDLSDSADLSYDSGYGTLSDSDDTVVPIKKSKSKGKGKGAGISNSTSTKMKAATIGSKPVTAKSHKTKATTIKSKSQKSKAATTKSASHESKAATIKSASHKSKAATAEPAAPLTAENVEKLEGGVKKYKKVTYKEAHEYYSDDDNDGTITDDDHRWGLGDLADPRAVLEELAVRINEFPERIKNRIQTYLDDKLQRLQDKVPKSVTRVPR